MKTEIYNAIKGRISPFTTPEGKDAYLFSNLGLNEGIDEDDVLFIPSIVTDIKSKNLWNVCQKFYKFLGWLSPENLDHRLLNS